MEPTLIPTSRRRPSRGPSPYIAWLGQNRLVGAGAFLFIAFLVLYFGFIIYRSYLGNSIRDIYGERKILLEQRDAQRERVVADFGERAQQVRGILSSHRATSKVFVLLENSVHSRITLRQFNFDFSQSKLDILGATDSYNTLAEQIILWDQDSNIKYSRISDFNVGTDGRLTFVASLTLARPFFLP